MGTTYFLTEWQYHRPWTISSRTKTKNEVILWQLPTFAGKPTIIGLGVFHFSVRNGKRWDNSSIVATT